ncbi:hypothetical protein TVAG_028160 [Trichomonas vaginalis G3]|uniref:Uncharacterized protein n=1 Tax=Trichomonas vaginalis (strain ATCC PRA-98 / G3) TaxID=412133 RepID=A2E555_TRIV3|nr:putative phospholipid-transporting ATPase family [Trichomonas vaginalis G3]EAY12263.1 hypothetical protein TVAG_028160 [Trichomonas vaginalis G3]KAI5535938.1 putative phospholipid-transporting ATPase family [Trichomonas vaginalis G3]|eukprot:XP_001324486.1 hypothetical protein [Trichomonas vaginalis G3]
MENNQQAHHVVIGDSTQNANFPRNKQSTSILRYFVLAWQVLLVELNSFYSIYFLILGIFQVLLEEHASTDALTTFLPLLIVFILSYLIQAWDFHKTAKSIKMNENYSYTVFRDHKECKFKYHKIIPGDIIQIDDHTPLPCDCIVLKTDQISVLINTSTIDGETKPKDKYPIRIPDSTNLMNISGYVDATSPQIETREISGECLIQHTGATPDPHSDANPRASKSISKFEIHENGDIITSFDNSHFVERGSIVQNSGVFYFLAIYTGSHCRTVSSKISYIARRTLIDVYLEKLTVVMFTVQLVLAIILGLLGYFYTENQHKLYKDSYIGEIKVYKDIKFFVALVFIIRNMLLLSFLIPITLKLILPVYRFIYGIFISQDLNFVDPMTGVSVQALSTNITENLGAIDVIVADKTGTLTKNSLDWISLYVGKEAYGEGEAASIQVDDNLKKVLAEPGDDTDIVEIMKALSICHSVNITEQNELFGSSADEIAIIKGLMELGFSFHRISQDRACVTAPFGNYEYKIMRVLPFNRSDFRMTVIVEDQNGYYAYTKGAPDCVIPVCTKNSGPQSILFDKLQMRGLRTLGVSYKKLEKYSESLTTDEIYTDMTYLGTIGIEDALQQDVQITVDVLQQAGLKIWIATGDAAKNTIITAASLNFIRTNEKIVHIRDNNLMNDLDDFKDKAQQVPENSFTVLVDSMSSNILNNAMQHEGFVEALFRARCVIFYRCKPQTKADIVAGLQLTGRRVLAVGDGANDTQLLRTADVGIGMLAEDGHSAYSSCDFAVPSFRSLCRLILIHGHTALHRSVLAVHFSFYKALAFGMCQAIYQIWTGYSGQSFFGPFSLLTFNQIWTFIPMLAILFEKDVSENFLYRLSFLYKKLRNPLTISLKNLSWMYLAVYQAVATMLVAYLLTGEAFLQASSGKDLGRDYLSIIVYIANVINVSFYMTSQLNTLTYYSLVLLIGNLLLLVAFSGILQSSFLINYQQSRDWQGFFGECFNSFPSILLLWTMIFASSAPAWLAMSVWNEVAYSETLLVMEKETIAAKDDQPLFFDPPKVV